MTNSEIVLYDSGRFPLWFRLPAVMAGILALWIGAAIITNSMFGVSLGISSNGQQGSWVLGSLASLAIGLLWCFVWVAQRRVLYDPERRELVNRTGSFLRSHEERFSLADVTEIQLREVGSGGMSGETRWRAFGVCVDGRANRLTEIPVDGVAVFAAALKAAAKVPVRQLSKSASIAFPR